MNAKIFLKQLGIVVPIILASAFLHELGHYFAAWFYHLQPHLVFTSSFLAVEAVSGTAIQNQIVMNFGPLTNLFLVMVLFFYLVFRSKSCSILKDNSCFYLIIVTIINLFIAIADLLGPVVYL